jgi:nitroimidazol reductase NimA-like FMN-containing flavoprotein (pyridoxamine 5'-phosphate oxidase superfamily)
VTREEQAGRAREVMKGEQFGVFAFGSGDDQPPYTSVMFFAETPDLEVIFCTSGGAKLEYAREGAGACVQVDTRGVGLEQMARFARVTLQGHLHLAQGSEAERLQRAYVAKLPHAEVFLKQPDVLTFLLRPTRLRFARGFGERFELEFRPPPSAG